MKTCSRCLKPVEAAKYFYCAQCRREKHYEWRQKNPERWAELQKRGRAKRLKDPAKLAKERKRTLDYWHRLRAEVMAAYGGAKCNCCGESEDKFLSIDHINNDGAEHRRTIGYASGNGKGASSATLSWIKANGFPPGFQVLCMNCNIGKARNGGVCPHQSHRHLVSVKQ